MKNSPLGVHTLSSSNGRTLGTSSGRTVGTFSWPHLGIISCPSTRIRALLAAGKPDWSLLATVTPETMQISSALLE